MSRMTYESFLIVRVARGGRGVSIAEIIIVVAILFTVAALGTFSLTSFREAQALSSAEDIVLSKIEAARTRTLASRNDQQYGVHFEANRLVLFTGATYSAGASTNEPVAWPSGVELVNSSFTSWPDVVFTRITALASGTGSIILRPIGDTTNTREIRVTDYTQAAGLFAYAAPSGTRVSDTRHVHFDLGWSIQDATTLRLTFTKSDATEQVENITMASYFSGGPPPTSFSWGGTFTVDGVAQTLRVYTHTLTVSNTVLSINRDRMANTKAVKVTIISPSLGTRDIVSYAADGVYIVLGFGGIATIQ